VQFVSRSCCSYAYIAIGVIDVHPLYVVREQPQVNGIGSAQLGSGAGGIAVARQTPVRRSVLSRKSLIT
jgi:hypothetical protein